MDGTTSDAFGRCQQCGQPVTTGGCLRCDSVRVYETPKIVEVPIEVPVLGPGPGPLGC